MLFIIIPIIIVVVVFCGPLGVGGCVCVYDIFIIIDFNIDITQVIGHHNAHLDPLGISSVNFENVPASSDILGVGES